MSLISSTEMLQTAKTNQYGIGAFNVHSLDMIYAVTEAASELESPVIIQTTVGTVKQLGEDVIVAAVKNAAEKYHIPMALHLDHCQDYNVIIRCIRAGYTSVMIDASMYSFSENVQKTLDVMKVTKHLNVNVEAELGKVGGVEDNIVVDDEDAEKAIPAECANFIEQTEVNTLAPAIGTAHGIYSGPPDIDFKRIEKIASLVSVPLVLHGGSAIPDEEVKRCVKLGMAKMNISTELKNAYSAALQKHFEENPGKFDPRSYFSKAKEEAKIVIKEKIQLLESQNQANDCLKNANTLYV
ncbi:ketose-bisphosphate aldolase [Salibacterium salarium]|uniref:Ketose-bisphosphate aldolase n=1 Tax=Salibacterium salarium TaxID=284579 RepID=A0A428N491_9BACI|nr:ketose-bisphosphate aldolase [Salibacterium salarium]RSL33099.1 ketose-bisphosphate aldolase [Salibacterium salarium]